MFEHYTKDELLLILNYFEQLIARNPSKKDLVEQVSGYILLNPVEWLFRLTERDLLILQSLVEAGEGNWSIMEVPEFPSPLDALQLIYVNDTEKDDLPQVTIAPELFRAVAPFVDSVIADKENDGSFDIERLALGYLNIFGVISVPDFVKTIVDTFDGEEDGDDIVMRLSSTQIVAMNRVLLKDEFYLVSPFVDDPESILKARKEFTHKRKYPRPSIAEALEAGSNIPYCIGRMYSAEGRDLEEILERLGYSATDVECEMHNIWIESQYAMHEDAAERMFRCVNSRIDSFSSFDEYKSCIDTVATYANSVPKWILKGRSANEYGALQISIRVDAGQEEFLYDEEGAAEPGTSDKMPRAEALTDFFKYGMAVKHVAPNAPCPCGSGLSYRLCHGKHLS